MLPPSVQRLIAELSKLPGIGPRTAQRLAFHILRTSAPEALKLSDAVRDCKELIGKCELCFNLAEGPRCTICSNERRDHSVICVVEEASDIIPVERTNEYRGMYHVLGGSLSPMDGVDPEDLTIAELERRVHAGDVAEVILATNPTTTGEATALYLAEQLGRHNPQLQTTRLASGIPVGADLEYTDEATLGRAFIARRKV